VFLIQATRNRTVNNNVLQWIKVKEMRGNACLLGMVVHIPWCACLLKNAGVGVLKYHKLHVSQDKIVRWRKRFSVITLTDAALATITS